MNKVRIFKNANLILFRKKLGGKEVSEYIVALIISQL